MVLLTALTLRPPQSPADWLAVAKIRDATGMTPTQASPRGCDHGLDRHLLVLVGEGTVLGTLRIDWLDGRRAALRRVAVAPEQQHRGIGAAMLRLAEDVVRASGRLEILLHAKAASIGFYLAEGYTPVAWDEVAEDPTSVNMGKSLPIDVAVAGLGQGAYAR